MSPHVDILEQPEHLGKSFVGSIAFHAGLVLLAIGVTFVQRATDMKLGAKDGGGGLGGVIVVKPTDIRLPNTGAPVNPVANDTQSQVPAPPPVKAPPKAAPKPENPNAIPIPTKNAKQQKPSWYHPELANNKFAEKQKYSPNQVFTNQGQRLSSPDMNLPGGTGLGGVNSPFGTQFGAYADIVQTKIASKWARPGADGHVSATARATVSFTLHRDGSVSDVKVTQRSGSAALDFSGQRAILDAAPLPPFPPGLNKNEVGIDFVFQLGR